MSNENIDILLQDKAAKVVLEYRDITKDVPSILNNSRRNSEPTNKI